MTTLGLCLSSIVQLIPYILVLCEMIIFSPLAVRSKNLDCVRALLGCNGIEVNRQSFDNSTPLHSAVSLDQCEMVRELLESGARVELMQDEDISPVFLASHLGRTQCLRLLVEHLKSSGMHSGNGTVELIVTL